MAHVVRFSDLPTDFQNSIKIWCKKLYDISNPNHGEISDELKKQCQEVALAIYHGRDGDLDTIVFNADKTLRFADEMKQIRLGCENGQSIAPFKTNQEVNEAYKLSLARHTLENGNKDIVSFKHCDEDKFTIIYNLFNAGVDKKDIKHIAQDGFSFEIFKRAANLLLNGTDPEKLSNLDPLNGDATNSILLDRLDNNSEFKIDTPEIDNNLDTEDIVLDFDELGF